MPNINSQNSKVSFSSTDEINSKPIDLKQGPVHYQGRSYQTVGETKSTSIFNRIMSIIKFIFQSFYNIFFRSKREEGGEIKHNSSPSIEDRVITPLLKDNAADPSVEKTAALSPYHPIPKEDLSLDEALGKINVEIKSGFPLEGLEEKYQIREKIAHLSGERQQEILKDLSLTINSECLKRFTSSNRTKIVTAVDFENDLIVSLGYTPSNHKEKREIYLKFIEIVQDKIKSSPETEDLPLEKFQEFLLNCALQSRLYCAGIKEQNQIIKFETALTAGQEFKKELYALARNVRMQLPSSFPSETCPLEKKSISKRYQSIKARLARDELCKFFEQEEVKGGFLNSGNSPSLFKDELSRFLSSQKKEIETTLLNGCEKAQQRKSLVKEIDLYSRWGSFIKKEMIQGFTNSSEVHDTGACFAICFRLLAEYQPYPDADITAGVNVQRVDRFKQALYSIQPKIYLDKEMKKGEKPAEAIIATANSYIRSIPEQFLKETNIKGARKLFALAYDLSEEETDFQKRLSSNSFIRKLEESNGWMQLSLSMVGGGHAVLMRLDEKRNKAWFFDPNIGLLCFEEEGKSFEDARHHCLQYFKEMASHNYPLLYNIEANQLIHQSPPPQD